MGSYPQQVVQLLPVLFVLVINLLIQSLKVANEELQEGVKGRDVVEALALPCSWFSYLYLTGPMQLVARPHYAPEGESDFTEKQPREAFGQRISMQKRFFKKK